MAEEIYAPIIDTQMTLSDAFAQTCRIAKVNETLKKGFRQVTKTILRKQAKVVVLAKDYPDNLSAIIIGLAKQKDIPIIRIDSATDIGKIVGFVKQRDGEIVKILKCGTFAITDFVNESEGKYFIENVLRDKRQD
ncbi:40S ribosomal protein S12 [Conglomerata obtusa]